MKSEFRAVLPGQKFLTSRTGDRVCTRLDEVYWVSVGKQLAPRNVFDPGDDEAAPPTLIYLDWQDMVEVVENSRPSSEEALIKGVELEAKELCNEGDFSG